MHSFAFTVNTYTHKIFSITYLVFNSYLFFVIAFPNSLKGSIFYQSQHECSISKNDSSRALCNECDANISRGKNPKTYSTSLLWNHIKHSHTEIYKKKNKGKSYCINSQQEDHSIKTSNIFKSTSFAITHSLI